MNRDPDLASAAALLADPARAAMLGRLLDGRSWTATELAKAAGIRPSTASAHLARLLEPGWVAVHPQGRFRYYRLAQPAVAEFLEAFAGLAPAAPARTPGEARVGASLRRCRLCYDHLAGQVGVALTLGLMERGWLGAGFHLTEAGATGLREAGLPVAEREGRACMDWSERRLHLAGPLGRNLADLCLAAGWLQRDPRSRALWITPLGQERLGTALGLSIQD